MAVEEVRGCGFRKVGGLYLRGEYISVSCDRLPYPLTVCPVCGQGIKVGRGFTRIIPGTLFGIHLECQDKFRPCFMCDPPKDEVAFIMGVGEKYYKSPEDFQREAQQLGVSKRIPFIPKELKLGETIVYLAHPKACEVRQPAVMQEAMAILKEAETRQPKLLEAEKMEKRLGIFTAFIPQRIEKLVWTSELTDEKREELEKRGITPIAVPDNDLDHK